MKTITIALLLCVSLHGFSQEKDRKERIQALKVAYLTEQLELTKTEAEKFWPIYNTFENEEHKQRKAARDKRKSITNDLTESQAKSILNDMIAHEHKRQQLRADFMENLMRILPAKKIVKLKLAEDEFNKKMFEEYKRRKDSKKD